MLARAISHSTLLLVLTALLFTVYDKMWRDSRARLHIATTIHENHHWRLAVSCQDQRSRGFAIRGDTETDSQSHNIGGDPEEHPVNLGAKRVQENKT